MVTVADVLEEAHETLARSAHDAPKEVDAVNSTTQMSTQNTQMGTYACLSSFAMPTAARLRQLAPATRCAHAAVHAAAPAAVTADGAAAAKACAASKRAIQGSWPRRANFR